jgi:hypothetical protein
VEIFDKDFFAFRNSKREKKSLSSGDLITAASVVQESEMLNGSSSVQH